MQYHVSTTASSWLEPVLGERPDVMLFARYIILPVSRLFPGTLTTSTTAEVLHFLSASTAAREASPRLHLREWDVIVEWMRLHLAFH